jgi:hypothetical protein
MPCYRSLEMGNHHESEKPPPRLTVRPAASRARWDALWRWLLAPTDASGTLDNERTDGLDSRERQQGEDPPHGK